MAWSSQAAPFRDRAPPCRLTAVRHGPLIAAASGPPIIQAVLWAGILLAS
jgi:hypothetical protein